MFNKLIDMTERLINWLSFTDPVSKTRVVSRYALILLSLYVFFTCLIKLFNLDASAWFTCVWIGGAMLVHIVHKKTLNEGLKEKLNEHEIARKFAVTTTINLSIALSIGVVSTLLGIICKSFILANGFVTAAIVNFVLGLILTNICLPREFYLKNQSRDVGMHKDSHYQLRDYNADFTDAYNTTGLFNPISPNYYNRH